MATTNQIAETRSTREHREASAGHSAAVARNASDGGLRWNGERWLAHLLALALAGALTGAVAFAGLAVTSAWLGSPHSGTGYSASEPEAVGPATWGDRLCCQETR
jgi:hypothetical protein